MAETSIGVCSENPLSKMARVKEVALNRSHQVAVCRAVRRELWSRTGGVILADGVGMGKTYEALGSVATLLAQQQHNRDRMRGGFRILCVAPPSLITKWADEMMLQDRFLGYIAKWEHHRAHGAVFRSMSDVVVLRRMADLEDRRGRRRYGKHELPNGFYIVNSNLLWAPGRKSTQLHRTPWDAIIIDEAHHLKGAKLIRSGHRQLLANPDTRTILLTATPFQLSPRELKGLLALTFGGYRSPRKWRRPFEDADSLYKDPSFLDYRRQVAAYFETGNREAADSARKLRQEVESLLRPRIIRNRKIENRLYHFVDSDGAPTRLHPSPFQMDAATLSAALSRPGTIALSDVEAGCYMDLRARLLDDASDRQPTFVAGALRQMLSTWAQYRRSKAYRPGTVRLPPGEHPKTRACVALVTRLIQRAIAESTKDGVIGKILIFTSYVGAGGAIVGFGQGHRPGTAATLKSALNRALQPMLAVEPKRQVRRTADALGAALASGGRTLEPAERSAIQRTLRHFAGSAPARLCLRDEARLRQECRVLRRLLRAIPSTSTHCVDDEASRRFTERRNLLLQQIKNRYATRELVARYDGALHPDERDRHLQGFNSPFAPLVLIASAVGQEGIDLQRYCRHVVHYDLEWNPAKVEQREGRVDRQGRASRESVNVYFMICRGTYDERIMHSMVNRIRWHQVLLSNRSAFDAAPGSLREKGSDPRQMQALALDLRPKVRF